MALYNEILVGRYNRGLQKLLGMKGGPPAAQLAGDIATAFGLETCADAELRYLFSWFRYGTIVQNTAQAANPSGIKLRNPTGSNVIAVVEQIYVACNVADSLIGIAHGPSTTSYNTVPSLASTRFDPRGQAQPTCILSQTSGAQSPVAFGANFCNVGITANNLNQTQFLIIDEHQEVPILPGEAVQIAGNVNNTALIGGFIWRERAMEESELA